MALRTNYNDGGATQLPGNITASDMNGISAAVNAAGDTFTNTALSVDSEIALFSGVAGKTIKRAVGSGLAKLVSGVLGIATAGTDYCSPAVPGTLASPTLTTPLVNGYTEGLVALGTVGATQTLSLAAGTALTATLTASTATTFTMPAHIVGKSQSFVLLLKQAAVTGAGTAVFTGVKWSAVGTPTQTTTAGTMDAYTFISDGTNWWGAVQQGYVIVTAPTPDNSGLSAHAFAVAAGVPTTWTQPSAAAGAYAIIGLFADASATVLTSGTAPVVIFGGQTLASLGAINLNNIAGNGFIWVFALNGITGSGSPVTSSVTFNQAGLTFEGWMASFTYNNVASVGSLQTAFSSSTALALSVPSAVGQMVWGALCQSDTLSAFTLTPRQQQLTTASGFPAFAAGDAIGAATVAVNATGSSGFPWAAVGLNLV